MFGMEKTKTAQTAQTKAPAPPTKRPEQALVPPIDVYENDAELLLVADVPGVGQNEAEVTVDGERLLIEAKGSNGTERKFRRELALPHVVDGEKISASMKAGVLTVHLPKRAQYQPRQIQVRGA
jgi:HSP20 family protein